MKTIYRNKRGQYITKKQYEQNQKKYQNENLICLKLTAKIMIVMILTVSIVTLIIK